MNKIDGFARKERLDKGGGLSPELGGSNIVHIHLNIHLNVYLSNYQMGESVGVSGLKL